MTLVYSDSDRRFTTEDLHFLEDVGRRAGLAIENARLYTSQQSAREAADTANRIKDEFLATVSHELRTPLNAILGWAKMLGSGLAASESARATETIQRNASAMAKLIEDLLDVSRIVSGKLRLDVASVDLLPIVEAAIESVRPAAAAKDIHLHHELSPSEGLVLGDSARLQQVVWNLLSNAVKFTPRGGEVTVAVRRVEAAVEIVVEDTGKGIDPRFLPHVFEPFRQAEGGASRSTGGLGLGLSITKQIVELHGGHVTASSEGEGKGASFAVRIPLTKPVTDRRSRAAPAVEIEAWRPPVRLDGMTVLSVDDDPDALDLLRTVLERAGARAIIAGTVDQAMKAIEREVPDVIISDIAMPGEDGFDLIRRVRALPPATGGDVPAAALTAYARAEDRQRVLAAGYMMHVPKPLDPSELVMVVATLARYQPRATNAGARGA
jgi:signal transduction histidine kinase/ActR/RegA family two-component response regulator